MQIKAEDILSLPQFTFGMHSRKQGFLPVRGIPDALGDVPRREDFGAMKREMEARYGPTPMDNAEPPDPTEGEVPDGPDAEMVWVLSPGGKRGRQEATGGLK